MPLTHLRFVYLPSNKALRFQPGQRRPQSLRSKGIISRKRGHPWVQGLYKILRGFEDMRTPILSAFGYSLSPTLSTLCAFAQKTGFVSVAFLSGYKVINRCSNPDLSPGFLVFKALTFVHCSAYLNTGERLQPCQVIVDPVLYWSPFFFFISLFSSARCCLNGSW